MTADQPVTVSVHGDRDLSPAAQEALGALIEVATGQIRSNAPLCTWPACLTPEQQAELADQVAASMLGEPTTPGPDQRPICGCREPHACGNCEGIDPGTCLMNSERREPDNETATALARHIASHPVGDVQAAYRLLGMELAFEVRYDTPTPDGDGQAAAVCHCGLGTRQQCATEPWGCAHERHTPADSGADGSGDREPAAPRSGGPGGDLNQPDTGSLRERVAAVIGSLHAELWGAPANPDFSPATRAVIDGGLDRTYLDVADAVLTVRDAELERLRVERDDALAVADADSKQLAEVDVRCDTAEAEARRLTEELGGARATLDHMSKAMSWISGHDRQGLDHLDEAQYEAGARHAAVKQARLWARQARAAEARNAELTALVDAQQQVIERQAREALAATVEPRAPRGRRGCLCGQTPDPGICPGGHCRCACTLPAIACSAGGQEAGAGQAGEAAIVTGTDDDYCGSEPPMRADEPGTQWGDCWCTRPGNHDGDCVCEPCRDRSGAPSWPNPNATIGEDTTP